jgi:4-amino-4-deoxy-L-arabinose transferase-like glycosyltransferase
MSPADRPNALNVNWMFGAIALLGFYLLGLDQSYLFDVDEGAFTEATREMLLSRDWGHTTLNGQDRFDKPIGVYWLQALSASIFGLNEFAFRLPSALSGWIASLAMARFAYQHWGQRAGLLAAVISATSLGPWAMARTATADALLGLFFVLIFIDLWHVMSSNSIASRRKLALWVALGLLVKGPVAIVLPLGTLAIYGFLMPQARTPIKALLMDFGAWFILLVVACPWYLYAYARHGQSFINGFILKHNVERFMGSMEGHSGHFAYFLIALPLLWLPWSALCMKAMANVRSQWRQPLLKYALIWFAFVFCFFSIANTKLPHYLLYAGPAMCLLLTSAALTAGTRLWLLTWSIGILGLAAMLLLPGYLQQHPEWVTDVFYKTLLEGSPNTEMKVWLFALPLLFYFTPALNCVLRLVKPANTDMTKGFGFIAFSFFQASVLALVVLPWWAQTLQAPVKALALNFRDNSNTIVQWGVHLPSFATYRQQEAPRREPLPGELALVKNTRPYWPPEWETLKLSGPLAVVKVPDNLGRKP